MVPAALAVGEQRGIDGTRFLRAVALGYDVGPRVTMCLGVPALSREAHKSSHSIAGVFGAAAAAGCAAALDARQMRWLLDYTAQQSSGIAAWQRDTDHIEKAFVFGGMPARSGVTAALLVAAGWTGIDDILSGPDNFILATAPAADPARLIEKLGERYEVMRTNIKMVGRLADPGAARRARAHGEGQRVRRGGGAQGGGAARRPRSLGGRQSRDPGYLPAAHGRHHAGRRHRLFRRRA